jgi:hypothetical protein
VRMSKLMRIGTINMHLVKLISISSSELILFSFDFMKVSTSISVNCFKNLKNFHFAVYLLHFLKKCRRAADNKKSPVYRL